MRQLNVKYWPNHVTVLSDGSKCRDCELWLEEHMGKLGKRWYVTSYGIGKVWYYFRNEKDAIMFSLRWL